jgi:hypothetical protein
LGGLGSGAGPGLGGPPFGGPGLGGPGFLFMRRTTAMHRLRTSTPADRPAARASTLDSCRPTPDLASVTEIRPQERAGESWGE